MKNILRISAVTLTLSISSITLADKEVYLFDLLKVPSYSKTLKKLISSQKNVDEWLATYPKTLNGPSSLKGTISIGGQKYQSGEACEQHNCDGNYFYVLFSPNASQAWILQIINQHEYFLGNPDTDIKEALRSLNQ